MEQLRRSKGQHIGGRRQFIVIDESHFRHKRKYGRGRMAGGWRRRKWVFGMLGVKVGDTNQRKPVLRLVERRVQKGTHATHHSTCQEGIHYPK
ncbi:hypothetical protein SRHO_G00340990 [Serrasalmus rhombeus]